MQTLPCSLEFDKGRSTSAACAATFDEATVTVRQSMTPTAPPRGFVSRPIGRHDQLVGGANETRRPLGMVNYAARLRSQSDVSDCAGTRPCGVIWSTAFGRTA